MKTIGIVILFTIFFIGAYKFGVHQTTAPLVHKADSLQASLSQTKSNDSLLYRQIDTIKRQLEKCKELSGKNRDKKVFLNKIIHASK